MNADNENAGCESEPAIVCIGCARVIPEDSDFCPFCRTPVGQTATIDPYKQIFAEGSMYRRFTSGTPRKWTFILEFILGVALIPLNVLLIVRAEDTSSVAGAMLSLLISGAFYLRMARNFARLYGRKKTEPHPGVHVLSNENGDSDSKSA